MQKIRKWLDGFLLCGQGILLAARERKFWIFFLIVFICFGTLMNLLSNGFSSFQLMGSVGFLGSLKIIFSALLGLFGIDKTFIDWVSVFFVALLQAVLVGLILLAWKKKKDSENIQNASIAAGLAVLGTGCPTCGTALLTPILGAIFSGASSIIGTLSFIITVIAILIMILSIKKVGEEVYVIIASEKFKNKKYTEVK